MNKDYNQALQDFHNIVADWYDEELERNEVNAKKNYSRVSLILKERIDKLFKK